MSSIIPREISPFSSLSDMQKFVARNAELIDEYLRLSEIYWSLPTDEIGSWSQLSNYWSVNGEIFENLCLQALENDGWDLDILPDADNPRAVNRKVSFVVDDITFNTEADFIGTKNGKISYFEAKRNPKTELKPNQKRIAGMIGEGGEIVVEGTPITPDSFFKLTTHDKGATISMETVPHHALVLR